MILTSISLHTVCCLWYFLGCKAGTCNKDSWVRSTPLLDPATPRAVHYGTSYYWAVTTLTTVGYGDLTPTNTLEMSYSIAVMILGKLLFGFILGTVASTLANLEIERVIYEDKLNALLVFQTHNYLHAPYIVQWNQSITFTLLSGC